MQCQRCTSRRQHAAKHLDNKQDHFLLSPQGRAVRRSVEQWSFPSCCDYLQEHMGAAALDGFPGKKLTTNSEEVLHDKLDDDWVDEEEEQEGFPGRHARRHTLQLQNGSKNRGYYEQLYHRRVGRSDRTVTPHEDSCLEIEDGVVDDDLRERIKLLFSMPLAGDLGSDSEEPLGIKPNVIEHDHKEGHLLLKTTSSDEYLANNPLNMNGILGQEVEEMTPGGKIVAKQNPYVSFVRKSEKGVADLLLSYPMDQRVEGLLEYTRGNEIENESLESRGSEEVTSRHGGKETTKMISSEQPDDMSKSLDSISEFSDSESLLASSEIGNKHGLDLSQVDSKPNDQKAAHTDIQSQSSNNSACSTVSSSGAIKKTPKLNVKKKTKIGTMKTKSVQNKHKQDTTKSVPKNNLDNENIDKINSYLDDLKDTTILRLFQSHLQTKCSTGLNSQLIFKFDDVKE